MKQFDVYRTPNGDLVCILQHRFLLDREMVMACLLTRSDDPAVRGLTPVVMLEGERHLLDIAAQVPIRAAALRRLRPTASLEAQRDEIFDALNLLYWGL